MADFRKKVTALKAPAATKAKLLADAAAALKGPFRRGYDMLIAALDEIEPLSKGNFGAWNLPDGAAYYADRLANCDDDRPDRRIRSTNSACDRSRRSGRRWRRSRARSASPARSSSSSTRSAPIRSSNIPTPKQGRDEYLRDARAVIASVMVAAPRYFRILPKAPLEVRAVEKWREGTASTAFYNPPSADGNAARHLLRQSGRHEPDAEGAGRRDRRARRRAGPSFPDRAATGTDRPAQVPQVRRLWRVYGGLGPVFRTARERDGRLQGSL